jgi:hypothetical protein
MSDSKLSQSFYKSTMFKMRTTIGHEIDGYTKPGKDGVIEHLHCGEMVCMSCWYFFHLFSDIINCIQNVSMTI